MMLLNLLLIVNTFALVFCSTEIYDEIIKLDGIFRHADTKIVNGDKIDIEEVPWQVSFQIDGLHKFGGSIIAPRWILTAAHCTDEKESISLSVRVGSSKHDSGGITVDVKRIINHGNYTKRNKDFDIALVELAELLNFTERIQPIQLSGVDDNIPDGAKCRTSGWGSTENPYESESNHLRAVYVPTVNQDTCFKQYKAMYNIGDDKICAGFKYGGKDSCGGDSGGPLICFDDESEAWKLVGVTSSGFGCGEPRYPGVYARVQAVRSWIENFTGI